MPWPQESNRHSLASLSVPNTRSFSYRPDFVTYNSNTYPVGVLNSDDIFRFMKDPESVESAYDTDVFIPAAGIGPKESEYMESLEAMWDFWNKYGDQMDSVEVEPDFLLDAPIGGASHLLYFISNGNPDVLAHSQSIRAAIIVYLLRHAGEPEFWEEHEYQYVAVLSPSEKLLIAPKLLEGYETATAQEKWARALDNAIGVCFSYMVAGLDNNYYEMLRTKFDRVFLTVFNDRNIVPLYDFHRRKMNKWHTKTKVAFWRYYDESDMSDKVDSQVVPYVWTDHDYNLLRQDYCNVSEIHSSKIIHVNKDQFSDVTRGYLR